jgi:V/A-type H+-transporting ATPase subunit E
MDLLLILPEKDRQELETYYKNQLASELNKGLELSFSDGVRSGFKIGPADGSYIISFSDTDFTNFFKDYLRPKTKEILFDK